MKAIVLDKTTAQVSVLDKVSTAMGIEIFQTPPMFFLLVSSLFFPHHKTAQPAFTPELKLLFITDLAPMTSHWSMKKVHRKLLCVSTHYSVAPTPLYRQSIFCILST